MFYKNKVSNYKVLINNIITYADIPYDYIIIDDYVIYRIRFQFPKYKVIIFLLNDAITCLVVPYDKMINDNIIYFLLYNIYIHTHMHK